MSALIADEAPSALLGEEGPFAASLPGFAPRQQQQQMADAVQQALAQRTTLVIEAGTGVGKTFGYLVPALLSGQKIIISTGTRHLQDQLFHRDLPLVRKSLGVGVSTALLKGRSNYLCLYRLQQAQHLGADNVQIKQLHRIQRWSQQTRSGDIAELADISETAPVWAKATSTVENCLGSDCPEFQQCHLVKARRRAQAADVVVINHHLLFADMALKEDGFGEILPNAEALILDEAHQLVEVATQFFSQAITARQLQGLMSDIVSAQLSEAGDAVELRTLADELQTALQQLRLALGATERSGSWWELVNKPSVTDGLSKITQAIGDLQTALNKVAERGEMLQQCAQRCAELEQKIALFKPPTIAAPVDSVAAEQQVSDTATATANSWVHWFATSRSGFGLYATPLEIGETFQQHRERLAAAWVFTSATLTVTGRFDHFLHSFALRDVELQQLDSPFDYPNQALLYMPANIPQPQQPDYLDAVLAASIPVLHTSQGRAFLLFTSHRALQYAAKVLPTQLDYPLFVQGTAPRSQLLDQFRLSGNGILLGTSSFWEGVDIRGEALSCVIIDKLPFAAPSDPVLQARMRLLREQGKDPFMAHQLPQAVIALKQGVGRLIRGIDDSGVLMIADPRLRTKAYGRVFLDSLPTMPTTNRLSDVERFFAEN